MLPTIILIGRIYRCKRYVLLQFMDCHKTKIWYIVVLNLLCLRIFCQFDVSGSIHDDNGAVSFANVVVLDSAKSVISYDISDEEGGFHLDVSGGEYVLQVSFVGYEDWSMPLNLQEDLENVEVNLIPSAIELGEVVVRDRKRLIELKSDRLIYNVENSIASKGGNALEAISSAPGVVINDNVIEIVGRGNPGILIQGRLLRLSGPDLISYLNSIPSDDIKRIELITNPPAKYTAEGTGGLINVVFKPGVRDKWKNSIRSGYEKRDRFGLFTLSNSLLYSKDKVRLNVGVSGVLGKVELDDAKSITYPFNFVNATETFNQRRDNLSGRMSIDCDLSKDITLGAQYETGYRNQGGDTQNSTTIQQLTNPVDCMFVSSGNFNWSNRYSSYNLHAIASPGDKDFTISVDLDYFNFEGNIERELATDVLQTNSVIGENQGRNISEQLTNNYSIKVDFAHLTDFITYNYGLHYNNSGSTNSTQVIEAINTDPNPFADFDYNENVNALYFSGRKKLNDHINVEFGLRLEDTNAEGVELNSRESFEISNLRLFPTLNFSYQHNENNSYSLNVGRRIRRPSFWSLNPFRFYRDQFSFIQGNPFLQPTFSDTYDFFFNHKGILVTNVFYSRTDAGFNQFAAPDSESLLFRVCWENYFTSNAIGLSQSYTFNKFSWWQSQNNLLLIKYDYAFNELIDAEPNNGFRARVSSSNTVDVKDYFKLQVRAYYNFPYKDNLRVINATYSASAGISKGFSNNRFQISLYVNDIFDSIRLREVETNVNSVRVFQIQDYSNRFVRLNLNYSFGNRKINVRNREVGNRTERRRAGT